MQQEREGEWDIDVKDIGEYQICFKSTDRTNKYVSFDFSTPDQESS